MLRKKIIIPILILIFFISSINLINFAKSASDNEDISVTLNCRLVSDSTEIHSNLMSTGSYDFWETPKLDTGSFVSDVTRMDLRKVQYPSSNSTTKRKFLNVTEKYPLGINSSEIPQYLVSAPKDTILNVRMNYTSNATDFEYTGNSVNTYSGADYYAWNGYDWKDGYFYWTYHYSGQKLIKKFDEDFNLIDTFDVNVMSGEIIDLVWDGNYWWLLFCGASYDWNQVGKFDENFNYLSEEHHISYNVPQSAYGIDLNGTHFMVFHEYNTNAGNYEFRLYNKDTWAFVKGYDCGVESKWASDAVYYYGDWYVLHYDDPCALIIYNRDFSSYRQTSLNGYPYGWACVDDNDNWFIYEETTYNQETSLAIDEYTSNIPKHILSMDVKNFTYNILGVDYTENFTLTYDSSNSSIFKGIKKSIKKGNQTFYFDSTQFSHYNYIYDITIPLQNITVLFNSSYDCDGFNECLNVTIWVEYSSNEWRVPSQNNMQVNSEEVTDESYNSGYVSFDNYFETLSIEADKTLFFELNTTTYFTFSFDLNVVSKTFLKKSFSLDSNHIIIIDDVELSSNLDIKKVYLNNIDLGTGSNNVYIASTSMSPTNIFTLEVILSEELYLPLQFIFNSLAGGTSNMYFSVYTNTLRQENFNRFSSFNPVFTSGWNVEHANFTMSNILYDPYYVSNSSENLFDSGYSTNTLIDESVDFNRSYYQLEKNATYLTNNTYSYYQNDIPEQSSDFDLVYGTSDWSGDLEEIDANYTTISDSEDARYNFGGEVGETGNDISFCSGSFITGALIVEASVGGRSNVLKVYDSGTGQTGFTNYFTASRSVGSFEYRLRFADTNNYEMYFKDTSGTNGVSLDVSGGNLRYNDGSDNVIQAVSVDTWYKIRVDYSCITDTFDCYVNDVLKVNDGGFQNGVDTIDKLYTYTVYGAASTYYWDDFREFDSEFIVNTSIDMQFEQSPNDILDSTHLYYSHKTNISQTIDLKIWNFDLNQWDLIESVDNSATFDDDSYGLNSSHYNSSNCVKICYYGQNSDDAFNLFIDKLKLYYNFTTDYALNVSSLYMSDALIVVNQSNWVYWNITTRFETNVTIDQKYNGVTTQIYNESCSNETLQSSLIVNSSAGFYILNITFTDNFSNYIIYTINYTIVSMISVSVAYQNNVFVDLNNTIVVNVFSENSIEKIYYDNSTDYLNQYDNSALLYEYDFNFTISYSVATNYDISVKVVSKYNDSFWVNVTSLQFIKRAVYVDILNLHSSYYQNENVSVEVLLRDFYNNNLTNQLVNYTLEAPNGTIIINSSKTTNINAKISVTINLSIAFEQGFYHLNVSFNETNSYLSYWKLISFDVKPIERSVNASVINLTINSELVGGDNFIQINHSSTFTFNHLDNCTFSFSVVFRTNYTETVSYTDIFDYSYTFSSTSDINSITFLDANISSYPADFVDYYYESIESTNYQVVYNNFKILDLVGQSLNSEDEFDIKFRKYENDVVRTQQTTSPKTDSNSVIFSETLTASRSFSYWYYQNIDGYMINSLSLLHSRTTTTISSFDDANNSKYYFTQKCNSGDQFTSTVDFNPNWVISTPTLISNNGTHTVLEFSYKADFSISNVTIVLDLSGLNQTIYNENWTNSAIQSIYSTNYIEIPNIEFSTSLQTITLTGNSSVPTSTFSSFKNCESFTISESSYEDINVFYNGYLKYYKYSVGWLIGDTKSDWMLDGVHYGNKDISIINETMYFECTGWGSTITTSYLNFKVNPIDKVSRSQSEDQVDYTITMNLPAESVDFEFYIETEERFTIESVNVDYLKLINLYSYDGKEHYILLDIDLDEGVNKIEIVFQVRNALENLWFIIPLFAGLGGFIMIYYGIQEDWFKKLMFWKKNKKKVDKMKLKKEGKKRKRKIKKNKKKEIKR